MPKSQVLKTPHALALRADSPHPQMRNSLLCFQRKKNHYIDQELSLSVSPVTLSLCLFFFPSLLFFLFLHIPWKSLSVLAPFPLRGGGTVPPPPSRTAHFTISHP